MAQEHRAAFAADLDRLVQAMDSDDEAAGKQAVMTMAMAAFDLLDRSATALERIASALEARP